MKSVNFRRIICTIVSFILCLFLFLMSICIALGIVSSGIYIKTVVDISDYSSLARTSLMTELSDLTIPSGLPIDFFEDKIDSGLFSERVRLAFDSALSDKKLPFSAEIITEEFYAWSINFANAKTEHLSSESELALRTFSDECALRYMRYANPSSVKYVLSFLARLQKFILIGILAIFFLVIITFILLYRICKGTDLLKHLSFSLSGTGLLLTVIPAIILISGEIGRMNLTSPSLYSLTLAFVSGLLLILVAIGLILIITSIILGTIDYKKSKNSV